MNIRDNYNKKLISIRHYLLGKNWHQALKAMEFAQSYHKGFRKDGVTPEFEHQLSIAGYLLTLHNHFLNPEIVIIDAFLHDVCEDYDVSYEEIEKQFNSGIAHDVFTLTKKFRNKQVLATESYYEQIGGNWNASLVKGADRIHNFQTISTVFSREKQDKYIKETEDHVLPMLKIARRIFTQQTEAYLNMKHVLLMQLELIKQIQKDI